METKHYSGLNDSEVQQSRKQFGENIITPPPHTPLWKLFLEKFKDPIIRILLVAAVLSLIISMWQKYSCSPDAEIFLFDRTNHLWWPILIYNFRARLI